MNKQSSGVSPSLGTELTRREFIALSTVASASVFSHRTAGVKLADFASEGNAMPLLVNILLTTAWAGDSGLLLKIHRSLEWDSQDVVVVCGANQRYSETLIKWRIAINQEHKVRRMLIHRPLTFNPISRTLERIHQDSERLLVDGWEFPIDSLSQGEQCEGTVRLAMELASRTHIKAVCLLPPSTGSWSAENIQKTVSLAKEFQDINFLIVGPGKNVSGWFWEPYSDEKLSIIQSSMECPNIYIRVEMSSITSLADLIPVEVRRHRRVVLGQSYTNVRSVVPSLRERVSAALLNQRLTGKVSGSNAASIYSLQQRHYRPVLV
jgi:hypothetical protein